MYYPCLMEVSIGLLDARVKIFFKTPQNKLDYTDCLIKVFGPEGQHSYLVKI